MLSSYVSLVVCSWLMQAEVHHREFHKLAEVKEMINDQLMLKVNVTRQLQISDFLPEAGSILSKLLKITLCISATMI